MTNLCTSETPAALPWLANVPGDDLGLVPAFAHLGSRLMTDPFGVARRQTELTWDLMRLGYTASLRFWGLCPDAVAVPFRGDRRFRANAWSENVAFDTIKQFYLLTGRYMLDLVKDAKDLDDKTRHKLEFFTTAFVDALSPGNFAATNPEVIEEAIRTGGMSLYQGFVNFLRDIDETGQLRIAMTDTSAFEVGVNVATTPGKVVFRNDLIELLQFSPTTESVGKRPLLVVPPWINKYYVLDLRPDNSFIKWAVDQGHTVFVISWVNPDADLAQKGFDSYLTEGALAAVDAIEAQTGESQINAVGYCLGGTLLGATLAYMAATGDNRIVSGTFFTSMLDFSEPGDLGAFIDEHTIDALEAKMLERGYLEGSEMAGTFNMMKGRDLIWSFYIRNYLLGKKPQPFDLLYWNSDSTRMPVAMHSFYLRNMYLRNLLSVPGGIELCGAPIDLSAITVPCYFVSAAEDHIAPWKSTYAGANLVGGPVRFVLGGSGHIAGIVNPPKANKYGYRVNPELPADPDVWLGDAEEHDGSWWLDWSGWVTDQCGDIVAARHPEDGALTTLSEAPGTYVKARLA